MAGWTLNGMKIRTTTSDSAGRAWGVVTGLGRTPELALTALQGKMEQVAQQMAQEAEEHGEKRKEALPRYARRRLGDVIFRYWYFEVVDVRFAAGPIEGSDSGWLAYGTLVWTMTAQSSQSLVIKLPLSRLLSGWR